MLLLPLAVWLLGPTLGIGAFVGWFSGVLLTQSPGRAAGLAILAALGCLLLLNGLAGQPLSLGVLGDWGSLDIGELFRSR